MPEHWEPFVSRGMETTGDLTSPAKVQRRLRSRFEHRRHPAPIRRLVEVELLPRIVRAHVGALADPVAPFAARDIAEFAQLALDGGAIGLRGAAAELLDEESAHEGDACLLLNHEGTMRALRESKALIQFQGP